MSRLPEFTRGSHTTLVGGNLVSISPIASAHALLDVANRDHVDTTLAQKDMSHQWSIWP